MRQIIIGEHQELFDFTVNAVTQLEKLQEAKINVVSMFGKVTNLKYSIRLHTGIKQLIQVQNESRTIFLNPVIANQLCVELVTVSIIWAHLRPDFSEGAAGDLETDAEALRIVVKYYPHFNKAAFIMEFTRLVNNNGTQEARIKAANLYLNTAL